MLGNKPPYTTMQQLNLDWVLSKLKTLLRLVPDDGAVGQILRRTRDGAVWSDEQGGGGGGAVQSVNGKTGAVVLDADDVGALPDDYMPPVTSVNGQTGDVVTTGKTAYSPTVVKTSGNSSFYSGSAVGCSGVVSLSLIFANGNDTSAGSNSFVGTIANVPLPYSEAVGIGFYGTHVFALAVRPDGSFNVRVLTGGGYWSASDRHTVNVTYISA